MKKLAIIGGGIVGLTLANYIDLTKYEVTIIDEPTGQATKASAGIISPWLSKRRNQKWYQLAKDGAAFYPKLIRDFTLSEQVYQQAGTLVLRKRAELDHLVSLAHERKQTAPEMGDIYLLNASQASEKLPLLKPTPALFMTGGAKLDGARYLTQLKSIALTKGIRFEKHSASLQKRNSHWLVTMGIRSRSFDFVALCTGAKLKHTLSPLGYHVAIRPQKGQLLVFDTPHKESKQWPVAMLDGESDLIPFEDGKIVIGATHENEGGFDLTPTHEAFVSLKEKTTPFLKQVTFFEDHLATYRVGTRAYTSDFSPFFNHLPDDSTAVVASGLGSSGLTTGPYIGYLLANYFNTGTSDWMVYQKPLATYITKNGI